MELKRLEDNIWKLSDMNDLEDRWDMDFETAYENGIIIYSDMDLSAIVEAIVYDDSITLEDLIKLTTNGYGGSQWTIAFLEQENMYVLIDNMV